MRLLRRYHLWRARVWRRRLEAANAVKMLFPEIAWTEAGRAAARYSVELQHHIMRAARWA
jgi:hypothetical protein